MCALRNSVSADESERYQVRAVTRALDVLLAFRDLPPPVELAALARHLGLHPTSAYRYLESLRSRGLVRQAADGGYEVGSVVFELSSTLLRGLSIWTQAPDLAQALAADANETASVGVLDNGQVLYIAIANGQSELGIQSFAGTRHPAHCTALGKALLADRPWPEVEAMLVARPPIRLTERTITDPDTFREELERVRRLGYSLDDEERTSGVVCIGAPIRDQSWATIAAVSISGPAFRVRERGVAEMAKLVVDAASHASIRLGASVDGRSLAAPPLG
jgi:IclR family transcriptional regulator, KDG regulon repressor